MSNSRLLEGVRAFSPLLQAYEAGYTTEDIRDSINGALIGEFENQSMLERYGLDLLTVESVNVTKVKMNDWSKSVYEKTLDMRRNVLAKDETKCAEIIAQWEQSIGKALSLYWSAAKLEYHKSELPLDDFAYELLRNIGGVIEGTLQVYLKELFHLVSSFNGAEVSYSQVASMSLGQVVNQLSSALEDDDIFTLPPWIVPLNQWRNIAQHFSVSTDDNHIVCKYGSRNQHEITLTREELFAVAQAVFLLFSAVRTSQTIFVLDNADSLTSHCKGFKRKEDDESFQFCVGAASQGFEVNELEITTNKTFAKLCDVTDDLSLQRALHASQFVYQLWVLSKSDKVILKYVPKSNDKALVTKANSEDCEKIFNGEQPFSYLSEVVEYIVEELSAAETKA